MFASIDDNINPEDLLTFEYPIFILNAENHSGGIGTPKWQPRSHSEIYVRDSPCYAEIVALVLNLASGLVSSQYRVAFDDKFSTVPYLELSTPSSN